MDKLQITLIPITNSNYEILRKWRNENREFFISSHEISEKEHLDWFNNYLKKGINDMYIISIDDKYVGNIRLTKVSDSMIEINNVLIGDISYRGKGVMSKTFDYIFSMYDKMSFQLEVLKTNTNAIDFYIRKGFKIVEEKNNIILMKK